MKRFDVPPPYTALARHPLSAIPKHDEVARFNFLAGLNRYLTADLGRGNRIAYEHRVLPKFRDSHGRDPKDRHEVRKAMMADPWHRLWSALKRDSMEMRQQNGRAMVLRQLDELDAKARQYNEGRDTLKLDPAVQIPPYQAITDIHCMPGSFHGEERPGDVSAGANYDSGMFATVAGGLGALNDGGGQALVEWIRKERPDWTPKRILDLGCTMGHNIVPLALAFPDTEVIAIDTAAAALRYAHARAQGLGARNIIFMQMDAEQLDFPDQHFDWVQSTMFLHELSSSALPKILKEVYRVLKPGGVSLHLEQPQYAPDMPLLEQYLRDWDGYNNNEPCWSAMHALDLEEEIEKSGFAEKDLFVASVAAVVDTKIFPQHKLNNREDHGRTAAWHGYGAWKEQA